LGSAETRAVEAAAIGGGLSGAAMMEAAGAAAASLITRMMENRPATILCGPGNNGGDGFVIARKLKEAGWTVRVGLLGDRAYLAGDAQLMSKLYDGPVETLSPGLLDGAGLIVDALFGTGLSRPIEGAAFEIISAANSHAAPRIAIDIPSGVNADTGEILGAAVQASATITFISRKPGQLLFPGRAFCGSVHVADIGVRDEWVASVRPKTFENHPMLWAPLWRRPGFSTHKYDRGHAAIVSGGRYKTGAARLSAISALRVGAGLVTMLSPPDACAENAAQLTAVMLREVGGPDEIAEILSDNRFTAALIGPGAGVGEATRKSVFSILESTAAAVLDADAISCFEGRRQELFDRLRTDDVITPHSGEFARLFPALASAPRIIAARAAAHEANAVLVFKGADTIVARADGRVIINANAPFDLATAGSGDVLAGMICGMRAQGLGGFEASAGAVWLHGAAGQTVGPGLIAEDLPGAIPHVLRALFIPREAPDPNDGEKA